MSRVPKLTYKVNLENLFGGRYDLSESIKQAIGQEIIDRIAKRTTEEKEDKHGDSLGTYSKSYGESDFAKIFGKKAGQRVNLTATGDMLASMDIKDTTAQTITIHFDDDEQNAKAYGHISGMKGHPFLDGKVQKRDFFGLPKEELESIAAEFESDVVAIDKILGAETHDELNESILDLIKDLGTERDIARAETRILGSRSYDQVAQGFESLFEIAGRKDGGS